MKKNISQVIIEETVALVVLLAILVASVKLFLYLTSSISARQIAFEKSRTIVNNATAGSDGAGVNSSDVQDWNEINVPAPQLVQ
jgi:hypothetical protein